MMYSSHDAAPLAVGTSSWCNSNTLILGLLLIAALYGAWYFDNKLTTLTERMEGDLVDNVSLLQEELTDFQTGMTAEIAEQNQTFQDEFSELEAQVEEGNDALETKMQAFETDVTGTVKSNMAEVTEQLEKQEDDFDNRLNSLDDKTESELREIAENVDLTEDAVTALRRDTEAIEQTIDEVKSDTAETIGDIDARLATLDTTVSALEAADATTQDDLNDLKETTEDVLEDIGNLKDEANDFRSSIEQLKETDALHGEEMDKQEEFITQLEDQMQIHDDEIDNLTQKDDAIDEKLEGVEASMERQNNAINTIDDRLAAAEEQISDEADTNEELETKVEALEDAVAAQTFANVHGEALDDQDLYNAMNTTISELKEEQIAMKSEQSSMRSELSAVQTKAEQNTEAVATAQSDINGAKENILTMEGELANLRAQQQVLVDEVEELGATQSTSDGHADDIRLLREQINDIRDNLSKPDPFVGNPNIDAMQEQLDALDGKFETLAGEVGEADADTEQTMNQTIAGLREEVNNLTREVASNTDANTKMSEAITAIENTPVETGQQIDAATIDNMTTRINQIEALNAADAKKQWDCLNYLNAQREAHGAQIKTNIDDIATAKGDITTNTSATAAVDAKANANANAIAAVDAKANGNANAIEQANHSIASNTTRSTNNAWNLNGGGDDHWRRRRLCASDRAAEKRLLHLLSITQGADD